MLLQILQVLVQDLVIVLALPHRVVLAGGLALHFAFAMIPTTHILQDLPPLILRHFRNIIVNGM